MNELIKSEKNTKKFFVIQSLRFIAFFMIFLQHTTQYHDFKYYSAGLAVSFFIILSGFLNGYKYFGRYSNVKSKDIKEFTKKKIIKIYGLHIIMILFSRTFTKIFTMSGKENIIEWIKKLFLNIFLLQSYVDDKFVYFSFNGVSWFLAVIVIISILTIPFINTIKNILSLKYGKRKLILIIIIVFIIDFMYSYIISTTKSNQEFWLYIFPIARIPEYFIGLVLGIGYLNRKNEKIKASSFFEILTIVILSMMIIIQKNKIIPSWMSFSLCWLIPNLLTILIFSYEQGIISKILKNKILIWLGDISMETYIIHQVMIINMSYIIGNVTNKAMKYFALIFIFSTIIIISSFIHKSMASKKCK